MSASAFAILLFGAALLYGATGSTLFSDLSRGQGSPLYLAGLGLVAGGVAFKVAAVPFHAWTPDVYEGAPTPVTAFMAAGVKTAAFAILVRIFLSAQGGATAPNASAFAGILSALAVLTMIFGNLLALPQRSVKRMLAYSSIAHAGYLLTGVVSAGAAGAREKAVAGMLFYLAAYSATAIGAFAIVGAIERGGDDEPADAWDLQRFAGLAARRPALAFAMAVFLLSLAGIPPTAGFVGKLYIFQAAVGAQLYGLAVVGVLTSVLGAYYYLRVVVYMYMRAPEGEPDALRSPAMSVALVAAIAVAWLLTRVRGDGSHDLLDERFGHPDAALEAQIAVRLRQDRDAVAQADVVGAEPRPLVEGPPGLRPRVVRREAFELFVQPVDVREVAVVEDAELVSRRHVPANCRQQAVARKRGDAFVSIRVEPGRVRQMIAVVRAVRRVQVDDDIRIPSGHQRDQRFPTAMHLMGYLWTFPRCKSFGKDRVWRSRRRNSKS